jgi:hypothetical protein
MKRDLIVEIVCKALVEDYYEQTFIKTITCHQPEDDKQKITIIDHDGHKFSIEIDDLGITNQ